MATTWEVVYRIPNEHSADDILADRTLIVQSQEDWRTDCFDAQFYDNAAHFFRLNHWELYLRRDGAAPMAIISVPSSDSLPGLSRRNIWQAPAGDIFDSIPRLVGLGAPASLLSLAKQEDLLPRFRIDCRRSWSILELPAGVIARLTLSRGLLSSGEKQEPYIELGIELLFGAPEAAVELGSRLASDFGLSPEHSGKYERALRLIRSRANTRN